ncbi:MAG: hypothetical protein ACM3WR_00940 [Solirubrobacterales bacterium]|jgi:hypothetical protein
MGSGVYRTEQGRTLRISVTDESGIGVEILQNDVWVPGSVRMAGLRLSPTTRKLTAAEVRALPA